MQIAANLIASDDASQDFVCWTRMQSEAGQTLDDILARKEIERRAGNGVFFWGVGNAPAVVTSVYARLQVPVKVVFSKMKSRPRPIDAQAQSLLVWRSYLDMFGLERDLPSHALVTSRGETGGGTKKRHYALMCATKTPLQMEHGIRFDPSAYRNVGGNCGPVGASQVTALLRRTSPPTQGDYEANLTATLFGSYWVRLTNPIVLDAAAVEECTPVRSTSEWCRLVNDLRGRTRNTATFSVQPSLF